MLFKLKLYLFYMDNTLYDIKTLIIISTDKSITDSYDHRTQSGPVQETHSQNEDQLIIIPIPELGTLMEALVVAL